MTTSAPTPEVVREWASEWSDTFAQDWDEEKLSGWVGKHVRASAIVNEEPKGFEGWIIGYTIDTLMIDDEDFHEKVHRYSLVTADGLQCMIFAGMEVKEVEAE